MRPVSVILISAVALSTSLWPSLATAITCADLDGASLYSQEAVSEYLGFFGSEYATDSINNRYGTYGSEYSTWSVRNPLGSYGSPYAPYSANNQYSPTPPVIARGDQGIAYLTNNPFLSPSVSLQDLDQNCSFTALQPGGGAVSPPITNPNQSGLSGAWADYSTDGQGFVIDVSPDLFGDGEGLLFAGWYTYATGASAPKRWYTLQGVASEEEQFATVDIYETTGGRFDSLQPTNTHSVGNAQIQFYDCDLAIMIFNFTDGSGRSGVIPLSRLLRNITCTQTGSDPGPTSFLHSGAWADLEGNSGQGLVVEVNPDTSIIFAGWYTFGFQASAGSGASGLTWYTLQGPLTGSGVVANPIGIYETSGGTFNGGATISTQQVGAATLLFQSCSNATLEYAFSAGQNAGSSGSLSLTRLTPPPAGCH